MRGVCLESALFVVVHLLHHSWYDSHVGYAFSLYVYTYTSIHYDLCIGTMVAVVFVR